MPPRVKISVAVSILIALLVTAQGLWAKPYICAKCGKPINSTAAYVEGKYYHPECFTCFSCGKPIVGDFQKDGKGHYFHPQCFPQKRVVICAFCNKPIKEDQFIEYQGHSYHRSCFTRHIAPLCNVCGLPLTDSSYTDYWGNQFHIRHAHEYPVCFVCGRLVLREGKEVGEGKWLCSVCKTLSVSSPERARVILEEMREQLASIGIVVTTLRLRIELVPGERLGAGKRAASGVHPFAGTYWDAGKTELGDENGTIYVLDGLPEDFLRGVIAHELMHIWQHEAGADNLPPYIREGSANWAASLIFNRMGTERGQFFIKGLEKSTDPIYGEGYRYISRYADQYGVEGVLRLLRLGSKNSPTPKTP